MCASLCGPQFFLEWIWSSGRYWSRIWSRPDKLIHSTCWGLKMNRTGKGKNKIKHTLKIQNNQFLVCVCQILKVKSLSCVWLLVTPWTAAYQAPPSMEFSKQEYWNGVPLPSGIVEATKTNKTRTFCIQSDGTTTIELMGINKLTHHLYIKGRKSFLTVLSNWSFNLLYSKEIVLPRPT